MDKRQGVSQVCGQDNNTGSLWNGTYPAVVASSLTKEGGRNVVYLESENVYSLYRGDVEITRAKTIQGNAVAYKMLLKKWRSFNV